MSVGHSVIRGIPLKFTQVAGGQSLIMGKTDFDIFLFRVDPWETLVSPDHYFGVVNIYVVVQGYLRDNDIDIAERMAYRSDRTLHSLQAPEGALVAHIRFPKRYLTPDAAALPAFYDTRENVWFLQQIAPNSLIEAALGFHGPDYSNAAHYQKTQEEAIFLLSGAARYGHHVLAAGENTCDAIISPPFVADDEYAAGEIIQLVIKTPFGGRGDKVLVGSEEDKALRASGKVIIEHD